MKLIDLTKEELLQKLRDTKRRHRKIMKHLEQIHRDREARIASPTILLHQYDQVRGMADATAKTLLDWIPRNPDAGFGKMGGSLT